MTYGPYVCIGAVLVFLFVLWAFWGGKSYEFVGLGPLDPNTCGAYTGSIYGWGGEITEATGGVEETVCFREEAPITIADSTITRIGTPIILTDIPKGITMCTNVPRRPKGRAISKGERICKETMERIYGLPFKTVRPNWLENPETGENVELDVFNEDLLIGVEYNGVQHYKWPNFTNQSYEEFINQVRRDKLKMDLCDKHGVYLIVVPYNVAHEEIPNYIISHLPETIRKRLEEEETLFGVN